MAQVGENLSGGTIARSSLGWVYACGWRDDAIYLHAASDSSLVRQALTTGDATELEVCAAVVTTGDPPRSSVTPQADGSVLVAVDVGGTLTVYQCANYDDGFTVVA
jgi:hypothetical protein